MVKRLIFLQILVLSLLIISFDAQANVVVEDADGRNLQTLIGITSTNVLTGSGQEGDYVLIACSVLSDNGNTFNSPNPGIWSELDNGICNDPNGNCFQGIWGGFTNNPDSESISCSWSIPSGFFVGGSFRYSQVDPVDPIVDVACNSSQGFGQNVTATAPSIETVAGSQVVRIYTYRNFEGAFISDNGATNTRTTGSFFGDSEDFTSSNVHIRGTTELFISDGPTGTASVDAGLDAEWRACTIAIRMLTIERNVPTMSEWGLIGFAAFAGIAGVWYLRRRQLTA